MRLERGEKIERKDIEEKENTETTDEHDPLRNTRRARPTTIYNRFPMLTNDDDSDDDSDDSDTTTRHNITKHNISCHKKHKPNKPQRLKQKHKIETLQNVELSETYESDMKQQCECTSDHGKQLRNWVNDNTNWSDEEIRDAAATDAVAECDWNGVSDGNDERPGADYNICSMTLPSGGYIGGRNVCTGICDTTADCLHGGNDERSGARTYMCGGNVCCNGATGLVGHCPNGAWAPARLSRGSQKQREGPLMRMMRRTELHNCTYAHTHTHTHDHNQHDHNDTHNHSQTADGDKANRDAAASVTSTDTQQLQHNNNYHYYTNDDADAMLLNAGAPKPTLSVPSGGSPPLGARPCPIHPHANSSQLHFPPLNGGWVGSPYRDPRRPPVHLVHANCLH